MKKVNIILTVVFVAAAVAVIGYAYTVFSNRYGKSSEDNSNANKSSIIDNFSSYFGGQNNSNTNENQVENLNENQNQNENSNSNTNSSVSIGDVSAKDCDNDCSRFKDNGDNYKYCQEVCGDIPASQKNSEEDCANLSGLEKDYCWRDLAVSKKDPTICVKISDKKLQTVCRNRVTEELLN